MFSGTYHSRPRHPPDLEAVISRARSQGVQRLLVTGTSISESRQALEIAKRYGKLFWEVGAEGRLAVYGRVSSDFNQ